ncbi:MAG: hypothetical protein IT372_39430 [Polyangiaceae bacterium]|nr:hypothetical protein [Polyangiaceae bacterium]
MSSRTGLGLLGALAAAALSIGCQLIYGLDDFESGKDRAGAGGAGEGGAGAAAGAGGGSSCACSPPIPQGWSGPFRVSTHPPDQSGAPCGDGSAANELLEAPPQASCTACACEIATACTAPTVTCYSTSSCSGTGEVFSSDFDGTSCVYLAAAAVVPYGSCVVNAPPGPGSCTPSGGEPVLGAWGNGVSMCNAALPGGACGGGAACIAPGSGDAQLCIAIDTTIACPPGWTEATMTAYRDAPSAPPP